MRNFYCSISRENVGLLQQVATSGEGEIYKTSKAGLLAKIYHLCDEEKVNKLKVMVRYPPRDPTAPQHVSIAWPKELLEDDHGRCVGFLMPEIERGKTLINVYHPSRRAKNAKGFNWLYLHTTALNIASSLQALHFNNYVVGDLKPDNLLVNERGLISIIDTDSFQIIDPNTQKIYYCPVSSEEFTPREMFGKDLRAVERTKFQDCFGLAVIIWLLLFGYHPFKGKWIGSGEPLNTNELIHHGYWMYGVNSKVEPVDSAIPLDILHPLLQQFFYQCFDQGHNNPAARPSAASWVTALDTACQELQQCSIEPEHYYATSYEKCYWCLRKQQYGGYDYFPATSQSRVPFSVKNPIPNSQQNAINTPNPSALASQSTATSPTTSINSNSQQFIPVQPVASTTQPNKQKILFPSLQFFKRVLRFGIFSGIGLVALGAIIAVASDFQKLRNIESSLEKSYTLNSVENYDDCQATAKDALNVYNKILIVKRRDLYNSVKDIESKCQIAEDNKHLDNAKNFVKNGMYLDAIEEALKVTSFDETVSARSQNLIEESVNLVTISAESKYDSGNLQAAINMMAPIIKIIPAENRFHQRLQDKINNWNASWEVNTNNLRKAQAQLKNCKDLSEVRGLAQSLTTTFYRAKAPQLLSEIQKCEDKARLVSAKERYRNGELIKAIDVIDDISKDSDIYSESKQLLNSWKRELDDLNSKVSSFMNQYFGFINNDNYAASFSRLTDEFNRSLYENASRNEQFNDHKNYWKNIIVTVKSVDIVRVKNDLIEVKVGIGRRYLDGRDSDSATLSWCLREDSSSSFKFEAYTYCK